MKSALYINPFVKYPEKKLLFAGVLSAVLGGLLAGALGVVFDGLLDLHLGNYSLLQSILTNFMQIGILSVFLFIAAFLFNTKTRYVDILNVALFYRIPFYISALFIALPAFKQTLQTISAPEDVQKITGGNMFLLIAISLLSLGMLIWSMVIMVNGFRIASNAKKAWHYILLAIAVLVAEGCSKYLFSKIIA